jgi:hypothetical protein
MKPKFVAVVLLLTIGVACGQGFIYDQQSADENTPFEGGAVIQLQSPVGQSFKPTNSAVSFIRLILFDVGTVGNGIGATLLVNLWSGSISNSTLLSSTTPIFLPDGFSQGSNGVVNFFFPSQVSLTANSTYVFQTVVQSGDTWGVGGDTQFHYADGTAILNGAPRPLLDLWFREGVIAVPEPSPVWLAWLGGAAWLLVRRRR